MLEFTFNVIPDEIQFKRAFQRFGDGIKDLTPAFEVIADNFYEGERQQFASQGQSGSGGWAALSPKYAARKRIQYPGKGILEATGALRESLSSRGGGSFVMEPLQLGMGASVEYAAYHQTGTPKMPRRAPIELTETQKRKWSKAIHTHLVNMRDRSVGAMR